MSDVIHVAEDRAEQRIRKRLDGIPYLVHLQWNTRESYWTVGLALDDGTVLLDGAALRVGHDLLRQHTGDDIPAGALVAIDTSGRDLDPGRDDLTNGRVQLIYLTAAEVAAAGSG